MSRAEPLTTQARESRYLTQTGRSDLTPAQRRRVRHKENEHEVRPTPRIGRLRRRYDRIEDLKVRQTAAAYVALIRERVSWSRFAAKPSSKTQQRKAFRRSGQR